MGDCCVKQNRNVDRRLWLDLLATTGYASPFQTPGFYDLCNSVEGFSADVFAIEAGNVYISMVVVTVQKDRGFKRFFSKRGIIYGGPLINENGNGLEILLKAVKEYYAPKVIYLETRNLFNYDEFRPSFIREGWNYQPHMNVRNQITAASLDKIISTFRYNRKREIKQSIAEGATWAEVVSDSGIENIYKILKELYKKKVKLPLPALDFFVKFRQSGMMKAFAVEHEGKVISGAFCPVLPGNTIYLMYYCGLRNYHPRIFPTHLAVLAAFEYGLKTGCRRLDFMGAGKPDKEYGVRKYKLEFGGELVEEGRFLLVLKPTFYNLGALWINNRYRFTG